MTTRQCKRIRLASRSTRQEKRSDHGEIGEDVASVSPRDITSVLFTKETSKDKDLRRTTSPKAKETKVGRNGVFSVPKEKKHISPNGIVMSAKQNMEVSKKRDEKMPDAVPLKKKKESCEQTPATKPNASYGILTVDGSSDIFGEREKLRAELRNGATNVLRRAAEAGQQAEETATSSSSSISKRTSRTGRTSMTYLQQTRGLRRAVAKARTERFKREREEEYEREQMQKLDGMAEEERERVIETLESERREREAARRREVKRVKNRESVEKSRVRDLVFEAQVGCEWDALRKENECMIQVIEWCKRNNVLKEARKEVNAVSRKRKRRKLA